MTVEVEFGPPFQSLPSPVVELASGVDALYLTGRAALPASLLNPLDEARSEAVLFRQAVPLVLGGEEFQVAWHGFNKYHFSLEHPYARIGFTESSFLPAIYVQPRTEFLQGYGPRSAVQWVRDVLESECGPVLFGVHRLDLFGDFQGWDLSGEARDEFVCRAKSRHLYEDDGVFNGLIFGQRKTGTVLARIYDKTIQSAKTGSGYWPMIWGERFDPERSVIRVEFEIGRNGLRDYRVSDPEDVLAVTGALWQSLTHGWLTHRVPTKDQTRSRWTASPTWEAVQRARVGMSDFGINRMYLGKRRGGAANLMPMLEGYLASFGAYAEASTFEDMLPDLREFLAQRERDTGVALSERIAERRRRFGLP
ncbi:MAG: hypothetical protein ACHQFZ_04560 [Acidimicrobiales bacterium]